MQIFQILDLHEGTSTIFPYCSKTKLEFFGKINGIFESGSKKVPAEVSVVNGKCEFLSLKNYENLDK